MSFGTESSPSALPVGEQLCTSCGLCCNGALHDYAALDPDESGLAARLGLDVGADKPDRFALPCPRLRGTLCDSFNERPLVCGRYRCQMLIDLDDGKIALAEAHDHVMVARRLLARLQERLPPGMTVPEARSLIAVPLHPEVGERARSRLGGDDPAEDHIRLFATALTVYLDRHFREAKNDRILTMTPVRRDA